jgi:hypothetical protein
MPLFVAALRLARAFCFEGLAPLSLNRPSRVKVRYKRLIQLQDFGRQEYGIQCVVVLLKCFAAGMRRESA